MESSTARFSIFILQSLHSGLSETHIRRELLQNGWSLEEINGALRRALDRSPAPQKIRQTVSLELDVEAINKEFSENIKKLKTVSINRIELDQSVEAKPERRKKLRVEMFYGHRLDRTLAFILDAVFIATGLFPFQETLKKTGFDLSISALILFFAYNVFFELSRWEATPGKSLFGLRVARKDARRILWVESVLRNGFKILPALLAIFYMPPLGVISSSVLILTATGIGGAFIFFTRRVQAAYDLIPKTIVLRFDRRLQVRVTRS